MLDEDTPAGTTEATTPQTDTPATDAPAAEAAGTGPAEKPAKKAAAKKTAAKKTAAKKAPAKKAAAKEAAERDTTAPAPDVTAAAEEAPEPSPDASVAAEPAKKAAKKTAAKKTAAKKAPAKKATTKKAAAAKAAEADVPADTTMADASAPAEPAEAPAAAKAPVIAVPLFQPPDPSKATTRRKKSAPESADTEATPEEEAPPARSGGRRPAAKKAVVAAAEPDEAAELTEADTEGDEESDEQAGGNRRRRRRGGRRRRKSGDTDGQQDGDETEGSGQGATSDKVDKGEKADRDENGGEGSSSRRRRRRRRSGDDGDGGSDDPENTVTRVRKPRTAEDEITALHGSTRLEAKKQRRREGREAGRRRAPIVSEAEFLARREAVDRVMVIRQKKDLTQIAVLEDKVLVEHYVARESQTSLIGNVYLGRVQNVLPSMEAAFIDIGKGRNAVLYAGEVNWDALGAGNGPRKIEQVLKSGQSVLVQVTKDPIGHKGARLTSQVSLPGRFLVYVPDGNTSGISRKLPDTERTRLKNLLKEIVPDTAGVIVRTAAEGASEEELTRDVERLTARWADIEAKVEKGNAPQLLYGEPDLTLKVVRDLFTEDFGKLVVSGDDAWDMVENYVGHVAPDLADRLERYDGNQDVFAAYRIDEQIAKALDRKVWLPSGGSLIIDRTEAMTVVDVNTGKFTGSGGNLEETVTKNNLEAAEEIVRQLRLRDIGGIIVVDFIDMVLESNRDLVLRRMVECLGRDRTRHQVAEVTSLGLVQMTRKRIGTGLLEAFSESCEHCQGRGLIVHHEPIETRKKPDEEPRRNRRGRGRGSDEDHAGNGNGSAPTPKDIAAMARNGHGDTAGETRAEEPTEYAAATPEPSEEIPAAAEAPAEVPPPAQTEPTAASSEPSEPSEPSEQKAEAKPTRSRSRSGRGSSRREAGPPAQVAEAPVMVVPTPEPVETPEPATDEAPAAETAPPAPRIVTSTRRKVARRPAGPPVGGLAEPGPADPGSVSPNGSGSGSGEASDNPDDAAHAPAHVPVKKKGTRKR